MILAQSKDEGIVLNAMNSKSEGTIGEPLVTSKNTRPNFGFQCYKYWIRIYN